MTLLIASITPVIIFLYLIFRKDGEREPIKLLAKCFFGGFLAIALTLLIDWPIVHFGEPYFQSPFAKALFNSFFVAAIPEEFSKFVILFWIIWKNKEFDEYYDGIVYAVFVSLGFALLENIGYVIDRGMGTAIARAIFAVPGHGFFAVSMGYFFSRARFATSREERKKFLWLSVTIPMLLHGVYDFLLMYSVNLKDINPTLAGILLVIFTVFIILLWRLGFKKIKASIANDKQIIQESSQASSQ